MKTVDCAHAPVHDRCVTLLSVFAVLIWLARPVFALDGQVQIHDPSTIAQCDGKFYTYGTGGTCLVSEDGWTWQRGVTPSRRGMAPDMIQLGDRYYQYISSNPGGQPHSQIILIHSKSLDPNSPDYEWVDGGLINSTDGEEFCNGIDPGLFLDPTDGKLWMTFGSYFGTIRVVELNPKTGQRVDDTFTDIAVNCEASTMVYHEGWYYLLATHGSCCRGTDSGYHIRVGRSKKVTGPFVDHEGTAMMQGGGKLVIGSGGRVVGAGHFGLIHEGDGVQKFSLHWEADMDRGGASVLDIRALLWRDGWPVAGENFRQGTYEIESVRTGTAIELAVEGVPVGGRRVRGGFGAARGARGSTQGRDGARSATPARGGARAGGRGIFGGTGGVIPDQDVAEVSVNWPEGSVDVRMGNYMCQAQQKWTVTPVADAGGTLGSPYFKVTIAGTDRPLAVTEGAELVTLPTFTGGIEQLWRLDQLTDGTWRIMPKIASVIKEPLALSAVGSSFATLAPFDPASDKQRWRFKRP
ncbi:MAG: family 43 glycosylhydrolase [Phycisphaerae bacterium]|nr:family 43 glycosylhydrolase [Phycisphaerae bacterium]